MARLSAAFDLLTRGADKAAADIDHVGNSSEKTGHKVERLGGSARLMASTFTGASNQALGPLQEIADKFDVIERAGASATTKVGGKLLGLGAAGLGAGSFLATLASREKEGEGQLRASITAVGKSYDDFTVQIAAAIKTGEHFGNQNATTLDALNRLTLTTHNPTEALKDLAVAQDVAAAKHVPLAKAAEIIGLVFNGSARSGKQFGLQLEQITGVTRALTKAQNDSKTASEKVGTAQQNYNDKLAIYQQTLKPTLAQQIALFRSHQAVIKAQDDAAAASGRLKIAQEKANDATAAGARNVAKLAAITKGQGEAAADSFAGHMRALGARVEDTASQIGSKYGTAINTVSLGTIAVGTLIETGFLPKLGRLVTGLGRTGTAFETLRDVEVATAAEGAAAIEAGAIKAEAAMASEGLAAQALGAKLGLALGSAVALARFGPGAFPDLKKTTPGALTDQQQQLFQDVINPGTSRSRTDLQKASLDDLRAVLATLSPTSKDKTIQDARALLTALTAELHPHGVQTDDATDAKNAHRNALAAVSAAAKAAAAAKAGVKPPTGDQSLAEWLKLMGLGSPANAQASAAAADAAKAAKQAAVDAATLLRDTIRTQVENAKSVLKDVLSASADLRKSIKDSITAGSQITDVFGSGPNLNANGAFGAANNFNAVKRFFEDRLVKLKRFAAELSALVHKGLDPALVAQIAQAGFDGAGGRLADALSGATKGQLGEISNLNKQVNQIGESAGKRIADVQFKEQIAVARKTNDILTKKLDRQNALLEKLTHTRPGTAVDQRAAAFLTAS